MGIIDRFKSRAPARAAAPDADMPPTPGDTPSVLSAQEATSVIGVGTGSTEAGALAADSSIISESPPSHLVNGFSDSRLAGDGLLVLPPAATLPVIGGRPIHQQQRILLSMIAGGALVLILSVALGISSAQHAAQHVGAVGQAQMQTQRAAKSAAQALVGQRSAFAELRDSAQILARQVRGLQSGNEELTAVSADLGSTVEPLAELAGKVEKSAAAVIGQERALIQAGQSVRTINSKSAQMLATVEAISAQQLQAGATTAEFSAAGTLAVLTQRVAKNANEFLTLEGVTPETVLQLGKDLQQFGDVADGLANGSAALRLQAARDPLIADKARQLLKQFAELNTEAAPLVSNIQGLMAARQAQSALTRDSETLRRGLEDLQGRLTGGGFGPLHFLGILLALVMAGLGAAGLLRLFVQEQNQRSREAEAQRAEAERQEREAKRVNDANQAAILRLMNELQTVAEGDLTQQATVTEDITGAIADSVNYTVEELRSLVSQVQSTVQRVTGTTQQVEQTSTELLAASTEQLREIRDTGESVLQMAGRINQVSVQAQHSAEVARQSLQVADRGLTAVQNTIGGMNAIRDQIQDTSKRIKRLGESSQEIGEITELISDITEQTNVLALNAAIQAASAGEAGRGFSVVAEEVQRLAERSADATRQISALVRAIQTDTQDAVAAMERSTIGVVEGAKLSDAAGTALNDIDRVTRELALLIERISAQASREAQSANIVATNIQHIFAVTEQTSDGTQSTAQMVRELSRSAEELRASVARFKVG